MHNVKTSFWESNGLFIKLLAFFISFWIIVCHIIPFANAVELETDYGFINVRDTWQNVTVKSNYFLGLYTKEDQLITTNFLSLNPDWGVRIHIYGDSKLRITANGKTLSLTNGEVNLDSSLAHSFGLSDTPIYISSTSDTSVTYQICCYGSYAVIQDTTQEENDQKQEAWYGWIIDSVGNFFTNLGNGIGGFFSQYWQLLKSLLETSFKPINSFFESISEFFSQFGSIGDLWTKLQGYTITPVLDFFESLDNGALSSFAQIWEFPVIRQLLVAVVAVLILGGVFMLFTSL